MDRVKRPDKRAERSRRTREKVVEAARELFVAQGYGATSLQEVADRAGVAVQTVYFVFGNKRTLFKDVVDTSIAGDTEPVATMDREWFRAACAEPTAAGQLRAHVHGTREILGRVAPIMPLIATAAATDPEIAAQWPDGPDPRYTVQYAAAEALAGKPDIRPGLSIEMAADLLFGLLSPQLYLIFVRDRDWSPDTWEEWARTALTSHICADPG
ncbi:MULTISPECIES: TetR/AcrR family transcriptional regulator [Micromonospora]|uniref:AcrR family transcriptional regulator n=1 Tax=Micromonospora vinacea TaxID=709878 RepID=A0ABS0KBE7_9ACTN|nr:TetR/AcrR family transcriptional regulator [Micromonospora vinacea]MBG6105900.1 AcrR family transcriptional regulator [Micromonospora vinacea]WSZ77941.1 TetR/AcrR family transcriptional regulator [Micromonospora sp. NBC_00860]WTA65628.1 TetR/AcrR family transcriptional regulator [Micromonospora sp. NBC_00855]